MDKIIKGGKVIQIVLNEFKEDIFSKEELIGSLEKEWSLKVDSIKFVNCSGDQFNFEELLDYFLMKGKLLKKGDKFTSNPEFVCGCKH